MEDKQYETVVNYIKEEIRSDRLRLGNKLPTERDLAVSLNLSRNSIREALRTLSSLGIIESRQGSGNYLKGNIESFFSQAFEMICLINKTKPSEIVQMRKAQELEAFATLIEIAHTDEISVLEELAEEVNIKNAAERAAADLLFHQKLIEFAGNSIMTATASALSFVFLSNVSENLRRLNEEQRLITQKCHTNVVRALKAHDLDAGINAIMLHYDIVRNNLPE